MTAPEDQNGLREALARHFDGSAFQPAHQDGRYWDARRKDAYRRADALIAGPLASLIAERNSMNEARIQAHRDAEEVEAERDAAVKRAKAANLRADNTGRERKLACELLVVERTARRAAEAEITRLKDGMEAMGAALKLAENPLSYRNAVDPSGPGSIAVARALDAVRSALADPG